MSGINSPAKKRGSPRSPSATPSVNPGYVMVIKVGTSSIVDEVSHLPLLSNLSLLVETVVKLRSKGHQVVIVTSGAIGMGLKRLGLARRPKHLSQKQAVAAVGQGRLMALYDDLFRQFDQPIAQVLLTRDNLAERPQYLNACNTFRELLDLGVVPIVNENDTVSPHEIRFGDNDTLSAVTAGMVNANFLFLLTDVDCLYTDNPRTNPDAVPVRIVDDVSKLRETVTVTSPGSSLGTGGMITKLIAADLATAAGVRMIITTGAAPQRIVTILDEVTAHRENSKTPFQPTLGTHFLAKPNPMVDRKWWILHGLATYGTIYLDAGAVRAITRGKGSLFAAGIVKVEGTFVAQQSVRIATVVKSHTNVPATSIIHPHQNMTFGMPSSPLVQAHDPLTTDGEEGIIVEIGKGIVNYTSSEIQRIKGCRSSDIEDLLGYVDSDSVVHRDNLVITYSSLDHTEIIVLPASKRLNAKRYDLMRAMHLSPSVESLSESRDTSNEGYSAESEITVNVPTLQ
ncbi:glutamate 5-kinase [Synchytrium microbalum]|uniref:Glutamate 5-kinase n=1 Tax=Synchytrium microbalum TaxID=1806994 RepID=A0A507BZQ5_9FUNG|nr:glutamate 5-kinase [Synchytrium microbalum]TPX32611.1 glutamate 5-kinase [Synchytrium microbalum]